MRFPLLAALCLLGACTAVAAVKGAKDSPEVPAAAEQPLPSLPAVTAPVANKPEAASPVVTNPSGPTEVAMAAPAITPDSRPSPLLKLAGLHRYAVVVDLPRARLYLLENTEQGLKVVRQHYAAMGKQGYGKQVAGDQRTPVGVYTISGFLSPDTLPPMYGTGAFPLSYPNDWDFHKKRTGSGIWLHGVPPNTYTRPPRSSEGCVTMANDDLTALRPYLKAGETPIVLTDQLDWMSEHKLNSASAAIAGEIENWRSKWSAIDTKGYLDYYASDFTSAGLNKAAFSDYKYRVNSAKKRIEVAVRDLDLFSYPGEENLVLAQFTQDYDSDNFKVTSRKQQFWRKQADGSWKIVLEESR